MLRQIATYRRVTWRIYLVSRLEQRYLVAIAFFWLCKVRFGLWRTSFQPLHQKLSQSNGPLYPFRSRPALRQLIRAVEASSRLMPGSTKCLAKAMSAQAIARQFNYELTLHIGVAKEKNQSMEAHAWATYQGRIVLGNLPDLTRFTPLLSLPSSPAPRLPRRGPK